MVGSGDLCLGHIEVYQRAIELTEHKLVPWLLFRSYQLKSLLIFL